MTDLIKAADALAEYCGELMGLFPDQAMELNKRLTAYRQARESADGVKVKPLAWRATQDGYISECGYRIYASPRTRNRYAMTDPEGVHIVSPNQAIMKLNPYRARELMDKAEEVDRAARIKAALED